MSGLENPQLLAHLTVIAGATLGNFARTMIPYWAKLQTNPDMIFEKKFLGTALVSFIGALGLGLGLFPTLIEQVPISSMSLAAIFAVVALTAYGINAGINWGMDKALKAEVLAVQVSELEAEGIAEPTEDAAPSP